MQFTRHVLLAAAASTAILATACAGPDTVVLYEDVYESPSDTRTAREGSARTSTASLPAPTAVSDDGDNVRSHEWTAVGSTYYCRTHGHWAFRRDGAWVIAAEPPRDQVVRRVRLRSATPRYGYGYGYRSSGYRSYGGYGYGHRGYGYRSYGAHGYGHHGYGYGSHGGYGRHHYRHH